MDSSRDIRNQKNVSSDPFKFEEDEDDSEINQYTYQPNFRNQKYFSSDPFKFEEDDSETNQYTYQPDFSDIRDESLQLWDTSETKSITKQSERDHFQNNDSFNTSKNYGKNTIHKMDSMDDTFQTSEYETLGLDHEPESPFVHVKDALNQFCNTEKKKLDNNSELKKTLKLENSNTKSADDEFWDFLEDTASPVVQIGDVMNVLKQDLLQKQKFTKDSDYRNSKVKNPDKAASDDEFYSLSSRSNSPIYTLNDYLETWNHSETNITYSDASFQLTGPDDSFHSIYSNNINASTFLSQGDSKSSSTMCSDKDACDAIVFGNTNERQSYASEHVNTPIPMSQKSYAYSFCSDNKADILKATQAIPSKKSGKLHSNSCGLKEKLKPLCSANSSRYLFESEISDNAKYSTPCIASVHSLKNNRKKNHSVDDISNLKKKLNLDAVSNTMLPAKILHDGKITSVGKPNSLSQNVSTTSVNVGLFGAIHRSQKAEADNSSTHPSISTISSSDESTRLATKHGRDIKSIQSTQGSILSQQNSQRISEDNTNSKSASFCYSTPAQSMNLETTSSSNGIMNPVFLLMPPGSETKQNPNYSHFFLIMNNGNGTSQQPVQYQTVQLPSKVSLINNSNNTGTTTVKPTTYKTIKSTPQISTPIQCLSTTNPSSYVTGNNVINNVVPVSSYILKPSLMKIIPSVTNTHVKLHNESKVTRINQPKHTNNSLISNINCVSTNSNKQLQLPSTTANNLIPGCKTVTTSVNGPNNFVDINSNKLLNLLHITNTSNSSSVPNNIIKTSVFSNLSHENVRNKGVISPAVGLKSKPIIKSIQIGKNKNAVQQISTPRRTVDTIEATTVTHFDAFSNINNIKSSLSNTIFDLKPKCIQIPNAGKGLQNNSNLDYQNEQVSSAHSIGSSVNVPTNSIVDSSCVLTNQNNVVFSSLVSQSHPLNRSLQGETRTFPQSDTSLTTLQRLLPPPVTIVPICTVQQMTTQSDVTKKYTTKSNEQIANESDSQTSQQEKSPNVQKASGKRLISKTKKFGRKTVKQLLEEREKGRQVVTTASSLVNILPNAPINIGSNATTIHNIVTSSNKRPNILILPSASKYVKKTVIGDDILMSGCNIAGNSTLISEQTTLEKLPKEYRPRHYDMSELQIGYFKVFENVNLYGRYKSKFKVLFNKRQFLYEFPRSRSNQMIANASPQHEQIARIVVPFRTVKSLDMKDRIIRITITESPTTCVGLYQSSDKRGLVVFDSPKDIPWIEGIHSDFLHKVVLRKRQANKLKAILCQFDENFVARTTIAAYLKNKNDFPVVDDDLSPTSLQKQLSKYKKFRTRRLPQWNSPEHIPDPILEDDLPSSLMMCSCRTSCRSVRCSCVKAAKSCTLDGYVCLCVNCNNPLNLLESLGLDVDVALQDRCLFQNIYAIPNLLKVVQREVQLSCCHSVVRVQDCIPGTVLCPNVECSVQLEYSWCRGLVCYPDTNPRNHCSFCGICCFSGKRHCSICNQCYSILPDLPDCRTCKVNEMSSSSNSTAKPKIILLDSRGKPSSPTESVPSIKNEVCDTITDSNLKIIVTDVRSVSESVDAEK